MRILNWGSLNLDKVYDLPHFVQAGETVSAQGYEVFCGGKGLNQSIALARAGAQVFHAGAVGIDGELLLAALKKAGADVSRICQVEQPSGHAIIQRVCGENCIIVRGGANCALTERDADRALSGFDKGDVLLVQNETSCVAYILRAAKAKGMRVALNPSPLPKVVEELPIELADWLLVNEVEGAALAGQRVQTNTELLAALRTRYPHTAIVLTLGGEGALYQDEQQTLAQPCCKVPVVDTIAAGDTFTGYFLAALVEGRPAKEALRRATFAAALAVTKKGAVPSIPACAAVENFLRCGTPDAPSGWKLEK